MLASLLLSAIVPATVTYAFLPPSGTAHEFLPPKGSGELVVYAPRDEPRRPIPVSPLARPLVVPQGDPRTRRGPWVVPVASVAPRVVYVPSWATYSVPVYAAPAYSVGGCANGQCAVPRQGFRLFGR